MNNKSKENDYERYETLRQRIVELTEEIEDLSGTEYDEISTESSTLQRAIESVAWVAL